MNKNGFTSWKIVAETIKLDFGDRIKEMEAEDIVWRFVRAFGDVNHNGPMTNEIGWAIDHIYGKTMIHTSGSHVNYLLIKLEEKGKMLVGRREDGYRVPGRIKAI